VGALGRTGENQMTLCPQSQHAVVINHRPSGEAKGKIETLVLESTKSILDHSNVSG